METSSSSSSSEDERPTRKRKTPSTNDGIGKANGQSDSSSSSSSSSSGTGMSETDDSSSSSSASSSSKNSSASDQKPQAKKPRPTHQETAMHTTTTTSNPNTTTTASADDDDEYDNYCWVKQPPDRALPPITIPPLKRDEKFVDWGAVADSPWGTTPFSMHVPELDRLVGFCHYGISSSRPLHGNPLIETPPSPSIWRPSSLQYISSTAETLMRDANRTDLFGSFQHSALVSVGMVLEEMMAVSLLPLARQHVERCRALDASKSAAAATTIEDYEEWTLPFEEAIAKLQPELVAEPLPTTLPPTRTSVPVDHSHNDDDEDNAEDYSLNDDNQSTPERDAQLYWCQAHNIAPDIVCNNPETFGLFLK